MDQERHDIESRADIEALVELFYSRAMADPVLGPIFNDVAKLDLPAHMPIMCDFWEGILLGARKYPGGMMMKHMVLHQQTALMPHHFQRWLDYWVETVDDLFEGERVDVRDRAAVRDALERIAPFDTVIGNAGISRSAPFLEITDEQWRDHLDVNLTGNFHLGQEAARLMVARGVGGAIVFTGSWVQEVPWPEIAAYSASKAGLAMLMRSMALELAPHGIRVNVIAPGIVAAGMAKYQMDHEPQYASRVASIVPLGRMQTPEDVARAAAFLCSDDASYMTGATLLVDGGCSLFQVPS